MSQQGATYAAFIQAEMDREYGRRDSVNSRATTAITSATGLVTLTLAAIAVIKGQSTLLHGTFEASLIVGVIALLVAAALAVLAGVNWRYRVTGTNVKMTLLLCAYGIQVLAIAALAVAIISLVV